MKTTLLDSFLHDAPGTLAIGGFTNEHAVRFLLGHAARRRSIALGGPLVSDLKEPVLLEGGSSGRTFGGRGRLTIRR